jgi:hypothetical protein
MKPRRDGYRTVGRASRAAPKEELMKYRLLAACAVLPLGVLAACGDDDDDDGGDGTDDEITVVTEVAVEDTELATETTVVVEETEVVVTETTEVVEDEEAVDTTEG